MSSSEPADGPTLPESPTARRKAITRALEILGGDGSASEEENPPSHGSSTPSALRDRALRDMLADFIEKTTQDIHDLQQRVRELEQSVSR